MWQIVVVVRKKVHWRQFIQFLRLNQLIRCQGFHLSTTHLTLANLQDTHKSWRLLLCKHTYWFGMMKVSCSFGIFFRSCRNSRGDIISREGLAWTLGKSGCVYSQMEYCLKGIYTRELIKGKFPDSETWLHLTSCLDSWLCRMTVIRALGRQIHCIRISSGTSNFLICKCPSWYDKITCDEIDNAHSQSTLNTAHPHIYSTQFYMGKNFNFI